MNDLISRAEAIDALDKRFDKIPMEQTAEILKLRKDLRGLPSIKSEQKRGRWIYGEDEMTNKEAINLLRGLEQSLDGYCELNDDGKKAFNMAVSALELFGNTEQLPSAQPEQRWIPCSERLPEQYGNYLVSYRTDYFESDIGTFGPDRINSDTGEWSACDANGFYWVASKGLEVIAWMPLPEPYKGGEQDE